MVPRHMEQRDCVVSYEKLNDEFQIQGKYRSENEEAICILGTVGSHINRMIYIPKSRIINIEFDRLRSNNDDTTDLGYPY
jgi:hypothetical protein